MLRKKAAYIQRNIDLQYVMVIILYFEYLPLGLSGGSTSLYALGLNFEECDIFIKK